MNLPPPVVNTDAKVGITVSGDLKGLINATVSSIVSNKRTSNSTSGFHGSAGETYAHRRNASRQAINTDLLSAWLGHLDARAVFFLDEHEPALLTELSGVDFDKHEYTEERVV